MNRQRLSWWHCVLTVKLLLLLVVAAHGAPFNSGDVLVGSLRGTGGIVIQYREGQEIGILDTGQANTRVVAMCTNADRSFLYAVATGNTSSALFRFNSQGEIVAGAISNSNAWVNIPNNPASACVVNRNGDVYVANKTGILGQPPSLRKYSASAAPIASFAPAEIGSATSIDLNLDQCTLTYTAAGRLKRFDVCSGTAGTQLPDIDQTNLGQTCLFARYTYRGQTMAICDGKALLLTPNAQVQTTYDPQKCIYDSRAKFSSLSFDPDGQTFWAMTYADPARNQKACRLNMATTDASSDFSIENYPPASMMVYGEQTAASRNCKRVFGKVLCIARAFPYFSVHDQPQP